jgi:hypothetical protein
MERLLSICVTDVSGIGLLYVVRTFETKCCDKEESVEPSELGFRRPLADAVVDVTAASDSLGLIAREINSEEWQCRFF